MSPVLPQIHRMSPLVSPDNERSYFFFSPTSPTQSATFPPPPSMNVANRDSMPSPPRVPITPAPSPVPNAPALRASPSTRSTATVNTRQRNRSAALAALEGRGSHIHNPQHWRPRNFMSMSDDDDDEPQSGIDEEALRRKLLWVLNEEEGLVIPQDTENVKPPPLSASSNSPSPGRGRTERTSGSGRTTSSSTPSSSSKRSRRSTIESFFSPLTNFIDLKDDDLSTSWRSFVQISS